MDNIETRERRRLLENCWAAGFFILLILLKQAMVGRLPAVVYADSPHDDLWVVKAAESLLEGQWLGVYNQYTLIKGAFSAMVMAFARWTGATYIGLNTLLYSLACLTFVSAIRPLFRRSWPLYITFIVLLFNPLTYAAETWQRIYRNGMSQWQVLFIFGALLAIFLRRKDPVRKLIPWALLGGCSLWAFNYTREDSVWILPFAFGAPVIMIIMILIERKEVPVRRQIGRIIVIVLPLFILFAGNQYICAINKDYYGAYLVNDRDGGSYADVVRDLYLIRPDESDKELYSSEQYQPLYYNIYASTLQKAYDASPAFASVRSGVDAAIAHWDSGEELVDGELFADHVLFALRDGVAAAGYYQDLASTEALYRQIHKELQAAFQSGQLEKEGISFSAMAAPWEKGYFPELMYSMGIGIREVATYSGVSTVIATALGSEGNVSRFESMTGNTVLREISPTVTINGWAFAYDDEDQLQAEICTSDGQRIARAVFVPGQDVYDYFAGQGQPHENALNSRYSLTLDGYSLADGLVIRFLDGDGSLRKEMEIGSDLVGMGIFEEGFACFFDTISQTDLTQVQGKATQLYVDRCNSIGNIYQKTGAAVALMGLFCYLAISGVTLYQAITRKRVTTFPAWLSLTAVLLSLLLFIGCVAYVNVSTFYSLMYLYLGSAFPLLLVFWTVSVCFTLEGIILTAKRALGEIPGQRAKGRSNVEEVEEK